MVDLRPIVIIIYSKDSTNANALGLPSPKNLENQTYDIVKRKIIEFYNQGMEIILQIETRKRQEQERKEKENQSIERWNMFFN